jgi:hypothetical protein
MMMRKKRIGSEKAEVPPAETVLTTPELPKDVPAQEISPLEVEPISTIEGEGILEQPLPEKSEELTTEELKDELEKLTEEMKNVEIEKK